MKGSHRFTKVTSTAKWIINWKETETTRLQWKIELGGLSFSSFFRGLEKEIIRKRTLMAIPMQVAYESPIFTPSKYKALMV